MADPRQLPSAAMDITSKELREVEFRERLRGYDTAEVDEFLERVAVAVDDLQAQVRQVKERADRAERQAIDRPAASTDDEESLRRTLVLAQRTADLAIKEAQEAAAEILDGARSEAAAALAHAEDAARRLTSDAQRDLQEEVERLTALRDQLRSDARTLADLLDNERERLTGALHSALRWVDRGLSTSPALSAQRAAPLSREGTDPGDGVEAQIQEDADAAAPSPPAWQGGVSDERDDPSGVAAEDDYGDESGEPLPSASVRQGLGIVRDEPMRLASTVTTSAGGDVGHDPSQDTQVWRYTGRRGQDAGWPA